MNMIKLLTGPETQVAAILLVVAGFVLGALAMCLLCKLCKPCQKGKCAAAKPDARRTEGPKPAKRHAPPADGSVEIYVGNLSYDLTEDQLRKEFEAYGQVNAVRIVTYRDTNKSKGFGFVHMPNPAEVDAAIAALNEKELLGRKMKCNVAKNVG